jgi:SH3-like domain-containing protein
LLDEDEGRGMKRVRVGAALLGLIGAATIAGAATDTDGVPYWASLAAREAMMRTGPGPNFPAIWKYVRPGLPVKVVARHEHWRKVVEPDGTEGWMNGVLLSEDRTAVVTGEVATMHAGPDAGAKILWRAAPGVVGRIAHCASGWCEFDVRGRVGYVRIASLWGVAPDETVD